MALDLKRLTKEQREAFEERAAILEYEAGMTRGRAELEALREVTMQREKQRKRVA